MIGGKVKTTAIVPGEKEIITEPEAKQWSLINLILIIIGVILAIITTIRVLLKKQNWAWMVIAIIADIAGIALYLTTQNMSNAMVVLDKWTIINVLIFAGSVTAAVVAIKCVKDKPYHSS